MLPPLSAMEPTSHSKQLFNPLCLLDYIFGIIKKKPPFSLTYLAETEGASLFFNIHKQPAL